VAVALAAGTFLYVCLTELLPEVFHHREDILAKIVLLALGIAAMGVIAAMEH
jgi:zinc transporter ZupT